MPSLDKPYTREVKGCGSRAQKNQWSDDTSNNELTEISSPIRNVEVKTNSKNKSVSHIELTSALESLNKFAEEIKEVPEDD